MSWVPKNKDRKYVESAEQIALNDWFLLQYPDLVDLFIYVPNGQDVGPVVGNRLKRMGLRKGFPDLVLFQSRKDYHGLVIEFKQKSGGRLTSEQSHILARLNLEGYLALECHGFDDAQKVIMAYLA